MMPARAALNAYYAWKVRDLEPKDRKRFDDDLNGWTGENERATQALHARLIDGGGEG